MSYLRCPNCDNYMNDDEDCLARMAGYADDATLVEYFKDYRTELWKCPECPRHTVIIYKENQVIFNSGFKI